MAKKSVFAIDLGASGGKCFVGTFENDSFSMEEIHRFSHEAISFFIENQHENFIERTYWDDIWLYQNIIKGLQKYRRDISAVLDSIGIDTWGSDGQFVTQEGDFIGKVYCYRDHRLDNMIDILKQKIDPAKLYEITGITFQPFNISAQLLWFMLNRKDQLKSGYKFLPTPSIFYFYLGNIKKVDSSWASVTQLMDAYKKEWSDEVLEQLGIPKDSMPEIVPPGSVIGKLIKPLSHSIGINQAKLIAVGSHDTASAFASAPVNKKDDALIISSGTWSLVGKLIPAPITSSQAMAKGLSNEGGIGNIRFLKNCMGSWLVQELRRIWREVDGYEMDWENIKKLAEQSKPFAAFVDPDNKSFYNPENMEKAIASFCKRTNQPVPTNRGTFIRVVYESLAMKYRWINDEICSIIGKTTKVVHIVGGGCKNELLNQFTSDSLGLPVITGPDEATAAGNIMVQAMGLGIIKNLDAALPLIPQAFRIEEYHPADPRSWDKAYDRFKKIVL